VREEGWREREEGWRERKERAREMKEVERWRAAWCAREGGRDAGARENERAR